MTQFWIGGYGPDMGGTGDGIGVLAGEAGREPASLAFRGTAADVASPSWLAAHPRLDVVYAALEGAGEVQAFVRSGEESLRPLGDAASAGDTVCHLAVSPDGGWLIASCYGDGAVVRFRLDDDGRLGASRAAGAATDPHGPDAASEDGDEDWEAVLRTIASPPAPETTPTVSGLLLFDDMMTAADAEEASRQDEASDEAQARASRAHSAAFLPDARIATTDLGFDLVRFWRSEADGLVPDHDVVLPRGVGPRHMVVHPSGHLHVVTEYSGEVFTLAPERDGRWTVRAATPVAAVFRAGEDFPAELSRSADGSFLYAGVRGSNTIAVLRVRESGERSEPVALVDSGVDWPRHHLLHDGTLLVAGQRSNDIAVLDVDERTGVPRPARLRIPVPTPSHLLLAR